ncbi:MAG: hypothetical protein NZ772_09950 [Cyanobacteria bacterium]|nr:hypothetical protein [Cyanobacteriota bacterium]MDW8201804.1 hypothetical protein [Cyanobacteriota bacterium SKYGB_h_bin112]
MRQEVVSEFLNLPGLAGLVLTDQRSLPYVSGVYLKMTSQQRNLLTHGISQVLASIPHQFHVFEFQFYDYQVFIHRLSQGITLLVIGYEQQLAQHYAPAIARLTAEIEGAGDRAVAMMRLLAGDWAPLPAREPPPTLLTLPSDAPTLPEVPHEEPSQSLAHDDAPVNSVPTAKPLADVELQETDTIETAPLQVPARPLKFEELFDVSDTTTLPSNFTNVAHAVEQPTKSTKGFQSSVPVQTDIAKSATTTAKTPATGAPALLPPQQAHQTSLAPSTPSPIYSKNVLSALNKLSQYTTQYLGNSVVANYWKSSRPKVEWLQGFTIERTAQLALPIDIASTLTEQQHEWIRDWVQAFIQRCTIVIRDFPNLVEQQALDETDKMLLL